MLKKEELFVNKNGGKTQNPSNSNCNMGTRLARLLTRRFHPSPLRQWSVVLEREKPLTLTFHDAPRNTLRIAEAELCNDSLDKMDRSELFCKVGDNPHILLCSLRKDHIDKVGLDVEFEGPDDVVFSVTGRYKLHLTGYYFDGPPPPTVTLSRIIAPIGGQAVSRAGGEQSSLRLTLIDDNQSTVSKDAGLGNTNMHTRVVDEAIQLPTTSVGAPKQPPVCIERQLNIEKPVNSTHSNEELAEIDTVNVVPVKSSMNQSGLEESKADQPRESNDTQIPKCAEQGENSQRYKEQQGSKRKHVNKESLAEGFRGGTEANMKQKLEPVTQIKRAKQIAGKDFKMVHRKRNKGNGFVDQNMANTDVPQLLAGQKLKPRKKRKRARMTLTCSYYLKVKQDSRALSFKVNGGLVAENNIRRGSQK